MMKKTLSIVFGLALILGMTSGAFSYTITDFTSAPAGVTITSSDTIIPRAWPPAGDPDSTVAYGVVDGTVSGEIDGSGAGEWVLVTFDTPQYINQVILATLYTEGEYADTKGDETAYIAYNTDYANRPIPPHFTLTADTATSAVLGGTGSASSVGIYNGQNAEETFAGMWEINGLFSGTAVTSLLFYVNPPGSDTSADSDFSLFKIETSAVPIPAAAWLLGSGLIGLLGFRKRFNRRG